MNRGSMQKDPISLLTCVFKYLESPNLPNDLHQCLIAIVHRAFDASLTWLVCTVHKSMCISLSDTVYSPSLFLHTSCKGTFPYLCHL